MLRHIRYATAGLNFTDKTTNDKVLDLVPKFYRTIVSLELYTHRSTRPRQLQNVIVMDC